MKNTTVTLTLIAVLLALFLPQFAYGQKAEAPVYKDGEWWMFQSKGNKKPSEEYKVTFKSDKFNSTGSNPLASLNVTPVHLNDPEKKVFDFPLIKGKKWSFKYSFESRRSGREYLRDVVAEVIGPVTDPLKTAAGKFKVIEIRRTDTIELRYRILEIKYIYFYSAETKSIVKITSDWESSDGSPTHIETELIKYFVHK